ncbi:polyprenol monophosphomannose synthase [Pseudomonadota bacterium]
MNNLAIIIPTLNERENIGEIIERISATLESASFEIVVVDDNSSDGTADIAERYAETHGNIKVLRRKGKLGLASAVLDGINISDASTIGVIDADLQEPPETLPRLMAKIEDGYDIVIGSRYVKGSSIEGWGLIRKFISKVAIWMAWLLLPSTRGIHDPSNGYFLVRRQVLNSDLDPKGFKILMEILVKCRYQKVVEVPIDYVGRVRGESKLTSHQVVTHLKYLNKLRKDPRNRQPRE